MVNDKTPSTGEKEKELKDEDVTYRIIDSNNKLGMALGLCLKHYSHEEEYNPDIPIKGACGRNYCKICFRGLYFVIDDVTPYDETMRPVQEKPKAIFFTNSGLIAKISNDLIEFGMRNKQLRLAHLSLVEEAVAFRRTTNRGNMDQNYDDIYALNPHDERAIG